ncbi:MAG: DUF3419 family protein [Cytophagaceae bacterium]
MSDLPSNIKFDFIRYANCWEDPEVLLSGLGNLEGSRVLSVGSGGDNSFALLTGNPEYIIAADISEPQLHLIELKKQAIKLLDQTECLELLGFIESKNRFRVWNKIKSELSQDSRDYWDKNESQIGKGLIYSGKFERYFLFFSNYILPLIHSEKRINQLFEIKPEALQEKFYKEHWNNRRWRFLFRIFFSEFVMGKFGRDPEFLREVKVPVSTYIYMKAERHLKSAYCQNNPFLRFILTGKFSPLLPFYLREENFYKIKACIDRIFVQKGAVQDLLEKHNFNRFNLSNIFEYIDKDSFTRLSEAFIRHSEKNSRFTYWNLMVPRRMSGIYPDKLEYHKELCQQLGKKDFGFFYNQFVSESKTI